MYPSSLQSLAHRAPATRTRVRWQPYASLPTPSSATSCSASSKSPSSTCFNSPSSSAPSSPISAPQTDADPPKQTQSTTPQPQPQAQPRDKNKFALGLVVADQAIKSLSDIWRPQDIPQVFLTTSRLQVLGSELNKHPSPPPSLFATGIHLDSVDSDAPVGTSNLIPIKGFVHEVLRRSRTSGSVLQTALCYLEAIRSRISELAQSGESCPPETELAERITVATEAELAREAEFCVGTDTIFLSESDDSMDTVRVFDATSYSGSTAVSSGIIDDSDSSFKKSTKDPWPVLSPLPPLPSPLLCPRRAFLASLILASKFTQDKCYSNRAWAKLSGLPPREIGRCERALGDALDWRLWVGKSSQSQPAPTTSPTAQTTRPLSRCRSENSMPSKPAESSSGFLVGANSDKQPPPISAFLSPDSSSCTGPKPGQSAGLRRAATLPAETFAFGVQSERRLRGILSDGARMPPSLDESADMAMYSPNDPHEYSTKIAVYSAGNALVHSSDTSPPTPGLSYSPTSTESSCGDRTIQMPCFLDDKSMSCIDGFSSSTGFPGRSSDVLPWLEHSPAGQIAVASLGRIVGVMQESSIHPFAFEYQKYHSSNAIPSIPMLIPTPVLTYQ